MIKALVDFCKDHYKHFNCFPVEFATFNEDGSEKDIYYYPQYLEYLSDSQIRQIVYHRGV